jgi:hypothetical protein
MSLPVWQPDTDYLVTARVTPTTPNGIVWWVLTAGTSDSTEPTWPTSEPWTVTDGSVVWGRAGNGREAQVAGLYTALGVFQAANPTLVAQISASRPRSLSNVSMPCVWVGDRDEQDDIGAHIRTRTFVGLTLIAADVTPDNAEAEARMDILVDGLVDLITKYVHAGGTRAITQVTSVSGFQPPEEGYYCQLIAIGGAFDTTGTD